MLISITGFTGEFPKIKPRHLAPNAAQLSVNARLDDGAITPLSGSAIVTDLLTPKQTVYLHGSTWFSWDVDVNVLPGPVATDRLYVTGNGVPKMYAETQWFDLALPAPSTAPTIANTQAHDPANEESVLYVYTWVTAYGEESAPSPTQDDPLLTDPATSVLVNGFEAPPANRNVTKMRIYRSKTSDFGETSLFFVAEQNVPVTAFTHSLDTHPLNEVISTIDYDTPPDDLSGIIAMPNGMMVGHTGRELHFCEPYMPHTWPSKYSLTVDYDIVGLAAFGSQLAVMTTGTPYRGQGTDPSTFVLEKLEENLPCLSKRGIVDLGYAAAYPSTEGLVLVSGAGAQLVTRPLFSRKDWQSLNPQSFVASHLDGQYIFGFTGALNGASERTGIIDLTGEQPFFMRSDLVLNCAYHDIRTGRLYVQEGDNKLYSFDDPGENWYRWVKWRSKLHDLPIEVGFSCFTAEGEEMENPSGFAARIIADGQVIHTTTDLNRVVRLPSVQAKKWEIEVEGKVSITSLNLSTSVADLAGRA